MLHRLVAAALFVSLASTLSAQAPAPSQNRQALIENAMSAAHPALATGATIVDHHQNVLREGTNGWVCLPDMDNVPNNSPMCLDAQWLGWMDAYVNRRQPSVTAIGFGYMLQDDMPVSNIDPFAEGPTPNNQWLQNAGPHIMIIVPSAALLDALPTDPDNGGPWVMWKGTPYAHIMVPTLGRGKSTP